MDKEIVIETLKKIHNDIVTDKFALVAIKKKKKALEKEEIRLSSVIKEKQTRLQYNLDKYQNVLQDN